MSVARNGAPCAIASRARVAAASRTAVRLCSVMSRKLLTKPSMFGSSSRFVDVASSQRHPPSAWLARASATTVRPGPPATSLPSAATAARSSGWAKSNMVLPRSSSGLRPRSRTTDGLTYTKRPCSLLTVIASLAWARNARNSDLAATTSLYAWSLAPTSRTSLQPTRLAIAMLKAPRTTAPSGRSIPTSRAIITGTASNEMARKNTRARSRRWRPDSTGSATCRIEGCRNAAARSVYEAGQSGSSHNELFSTPRDETTRTRCRRSWS